MITVRHTHSTIPLNAGQVEGWKDIPIEESFEPLIPLGPFSPEANILATSSLYFGEHNNSPYRNTNKLKGSLLTLFARRSTARRLLAAEQLLPAGYHLLVFDAYRPYEVQKSLHDFYKEKLTQKFPNESNEILEFETQKYVSLPSTNLKRPSPHSTGGVVDVVIVKLEPKYEKELFDIRSSLANTTLSFAQRVGLEIRLAALMSHAKMLNFGTPFDHGGEKAALAYYESKLAAGDHLSAEERQACDNRRLLHNVMTQAGFQPYFAEWWHFDAPETQWGAATGTLSSARFGAATLTKSNKDFETMRLAVYKDTAELQSSAVKTTKTTPLQTEISTALRVTKTLAHKRNWPAEIIAPL